MWSASTGASGFGGFVPAKEMKSGGVMDFLGRSTNPAPKISGMPSPVSCNDAPQTVAANESGRDFCKIASTLRVFSVHLTLYNEPALLHANLFNSSDFVFATFRR